MEKEVQSSNIPRRGSQGKKTWIRTSSSKKISTKKLE
jgi:hypothetical protein